jgi:nucleoid-associated protein YgaU
VLVAGAVAFVALRDTPATQDESPVLEDRVTAAAPDSTPPDLAPSDVALPTVPPADPATPEPASDPIPPSFDLVRIDGTGSAVIAGQAEAGATVTLRIDGAPVESADADAGGNFVTMLALAPSDAPRVLSLEATGASGAPVPGTQTVLIAPFSGEAVAAATPEPAPAPPPTQVAAAPPGSGGQPASPVATPPEPAPILRAERPGLGETTSAPPAAPDAPLPPDPAATPTSDLADLRPEPAPTPDTDPASPAVADSFMPPSAPRPAEPMTPPAAVLTAPPVEATPRAPAILLADDAGVRVLQAPGAPPSAQTAIMLDAITYDAEGAVMLAGRGPADASVRVMLNNQPINMGEIGPGGQWSLDLPDVDPGTYTLRLEQVAADGTVTRSVETPFLREDPARIRDNPMLVAPDASVITVQRGFTLWGIAEANFGEGILYVQIFDQNRDQIRDPDLIFPGQIFALPDLPRAEGAGDD